MTENSAPTPMVAIAPTTEAAESTWYDNRLPLGAFAINFSAYTADASVVDVNPFYFEVEVNGQAVRCSDDGYFRVEGRDKPGRWRVIKIPTTKTIGCMVDGYGVTNGSEN